jgi:hypothetical protein
MILFIFTYLILQRFKTFNLNLVRPLTAIIHPISTDSVIFMSLVFTVQYSFPYSKYGSRAAVQNFNRVLWNFVFNSTIIYLFFTFTILYTTCVRCYLHFIGICRLHLQCRRIRVRSWTWTHEVAPKCRQHCLLPLRAMTLQQNQHEHNISRCCRMQYQH